MALGSFLPDTTIVNMVVILVATGFMWLGAGLLQESAEYLSTYYALPSVVQGSIVVSIGSSFPELASVVFIALAGVFDISVGAVVESTIFNILVIPAIAEILVDGHMESTALLSTRRRSSTLANYQLLTLLPPEVVDSGTR